MVVVAGVVAAVAVGHRRHSQSLVRVILLVVVESSVSMLRSARCHVIAIGFGIAVFIWLLQSALFSSHLHLQLLFWLLCLLLL